MTHSHLALRLLLSFASAGLAARPAVNFNRALREDTPDLKVALKSAKGSVNEMLPRHVDAQMPQVQDAMNQIDKYVRPAAETCECDSNLYATNLATSDAVKDLVGLWHFKIQNRIGSFSISISGTELSLIRNLDGNVLEASLHFSGEWWNGIASINGVGPHEAIRIRRRGDKLLSNIKGPGDDQWRRTIVASKDADPASLAVQCDEIYDRDSKINFAAAKRCLDSTGFVHIQMPTGEHIIDNAFVLSQNGTMLVQGDGGDEADVVITCSGEHPAFKLDNGAELLLEGVVVDKCSMDRGKYAGAIEVFDKENARLRLQRRGGIRSSRGSGVSIHRSKNFMAVLEDNSSISDSGNHGLVVAHGQNNILCLCSSTIRGSASDGIRAWHSHRNSVFLYKSAIESGINGINFVVAHSNALRLGYSTINGSTENGLRVKHGSTFNFILGYSTISSSGVSGISVAKPFNHTYTLGYSTINGSGGDGFQVYSARRCTFNLGHVAITNSGHHGILTRNLGRGNTMNLGHSTISASRMDGFHNVGGSHGIFSIGYSTIRGSGREGLRTSTGKNHTFSLAYSTIIDSGRNGLSADSGQNDTFSLAHSTISTSGQYGVFSHKGGSFSLRHSTIKDSGKDCFMSGGSILIGDCTFEDCRSCAVNAKGDDVNLTITNTNYRNSFIGIKTIHPASTTTIRNTTLWKMTSVAVIASLGLLHTENVRVFASSTAFLIGQTTWDGLDTTIMGNGIGILCNGAVQGTLATSFVYLNGLRDVRNCGMLVLDEPLPMRMHAGQLKAYVVKTLFLAMVLTMGLPIIQDPPRDLHACSWPLVILSFAAAVLWLGTIMVVLWTAYELFQREEHDESKYGANARAMSMQLLSFVIISITTTIFATLAAIWARKKYTFLRLTAQLHLDSEERRKCQHQLARERGNYSQELHQHHEAMVKHISCATCCKDIAEGKHYLKAAHDQFDQMQKLAREEGKDLDLKLHYDVQTMYKDDPLRWQTLLDIESITLKGRYQGEHMVPFLNVVEGELKLINIEELNEEVTRRLLLAASWGHSVFQSSLEKVATRLNEQDHVDDLICELSQQFPSVAQQLQNLLPEVRNLKSPGYNLLHDVHATLCGRHCNLVMGPNKTHASASRKAAQLDDDHKKKPPKDTAQWQTPAARYLYDLLRATVVFSDPVAMVIYYHLLQTEFTVISIKNKYRDPLEKVGSPSILVNLEVDTNFGKFITEVQLYLDKFLDLKFLSHTNYEIDRVMDSMELLAPFSH